MSEVFHCRYCGSTEKHDRRKCRNAEQWKDPEFRKRFSDGVRVKWKDPAFKKRVLDARRATQGKLIDSLSDYERSVYHECRADGFGHRDAFEIARDAGQMGEA